MEPQEPSAPINPTPVPEPTTPPPPVITPNTPVTPPPTPAPAPDPQIPASGPQVFGPAAPSVSEPSSPSLGGAFTSQVSTPPPAPKSKKKLFIMSGAGLVILVGAVLAYYFGYYMNPAVIWNQSLSNTNKGYSKLVDYANKQSTVTYKGAKVSGSVTVKSGSTSYSGSVSGQSDGNNSTGSIKFGLGVANLDLEGRTIKPTSQKSPDIYFQLSGFKSLVANSDFGIDPAQLGSLDGQWVKVDHTLIDSIEAKVAPDAKTSTKSTLTRPQVIDAAKRFGDVNAQYVFTTKKSKAITTIVKNYGFETVDGHKTYHYKVGFVKANVKAYITAIRDSFQQSQLGAWATKQTGQSASDIMGYTDLEKSADNIKNTDTIDVWANAGNRLIYKVRISEQANPATNFAEIGLNYTNGHSYPLFLNFQNGKGANAATVKVTTTIDTQLNSVAATMTVNASDVSADAKLSAQPTNDEVTVSAPAGAISLQDALNKLGLGDLYTEILQNLNATSGSSGNSSVNALNSILPSLN